MSKATLESMNALHGAMASYFTDILSSGDVDPKEIGNILRFLKDNDVTMDAIEGSPMQDLVAQFNMNRKAIEDSTR